MKSWKTILFIVAALGLATCLALLAYLASRSHSPSSSTITQQDGATPLKPDPYMQDLSIPPFHFTDQLGRSIDQEQLLGNVTLINFMFTNCVTICPLMTGTTLELNNRLADTNARFISISVDPEHDTVEKLADYANKFSADPERWRFATGDRDQVLTILRDGLMFDLSFDPSASSAIQLADGSSMPNIIHPSRYFLVGPKGTILGMYNYEDDQQLDALVQRVQAIDTILKNN